MNLDNNETADAIRTALAMLPEECTLRMSRMRRQLHEHNIYRWTRLLGELAPVREAVTAARV